MTEPKPLHRRFKIMCGEELKCASGVYLRRWGIEVWYFSLRLHHWLRPDDSRAFHDHPWWFITIPLKGAYFDVSPAAENLECDPEEEVLVEKIQPGKIRFRPAHHKHFALVCKGGCWTFLVTGPKMRRWGFWEKGKFLLSYRYFYHRGPHVCD